VIFPKTLSPAGALFARSQKNKGAYCAQKKLENINNNINILSIIYFFWEEEVPNLLG